jgi:Zn-dependent alcohol dehydrogenase
MKTRAAVLRDMGKDWEITELDLDPPKDGEVLIRFAAAGLCHSDDHLRTGDIPVRYPIVGGHEGAGVVEEVVRDNRLAGRTVRLAGQTGGGGR